MESTSSKYFIYFSFYAIMQCRSRITQYYGCRAKTVLHKLPYVWLRRFLGVMDEFITENKQKMMVNKG